MKTAVNQASWHLARGLEESFLDKLWIIAPTGAMILAAVFVTWRLSVVLMKIYTENETQHALMRQSIEHLNTRIESLETQVNAKCDLIFGLLIKKKKRSQRKS